MHPGVEMQDANGEKNVPSHDRERLAQTRGCPRDNRTRPRPIAGAAAVNGREVRGVKFFYDRRDDDVVDCCSDSFAHRAKPTVGVKRARHPRPL